MKRTAHNVKSWFYHRRYLPDWVAYLPIIGTYLENH
jgi:hypothetical protein